jgi:hypothetical protein
MESVEERWETLKNKVDLYPDPPMETATMEARVTEEGSHYYKKTNHPLTRHDFVLPGIDEPFRVIYSWAYCDKCREMIWKEIVAYWNTTVGYGWGGRCYKREIYRKK